MTRSLKPVLIAALALAAPVAQASAATTKAVYPSVSKVSPMRVAIGETMTIKGKGFRAGKNRNTVVFQRTGSPAVFVRVGKASTTSLTLLVPAKLAPFLATKKGAAVPTTFRLRILSARFSKAFTSGSLSPVVTPKGADKPVGTTIGATPVAPAAPTCQQIAAADPFGDKDADGISNAREAEIGTDPCNPDTDGDGMVDGYEYQSALDLNGIALPYPGKRPWPNPLDPSDAKYDFDGDGLTLGQEYKLWRFTGAAFPVSQYSDGTQNSGGRQYVTSASDVALDRDGNGILTDDERDADGDGLSNIVELSTRGTQAWWAGVYPGEAPYTARPFSELDPTMYDTDGDGIPDGADDQDDDGYDNLAEMQYARLRPAPGQTQILRMQPFNPCLPNPWSRTCSRYVPLGGTPWAPFDGSQKAGDMIPFQLPSVNGTTLANTWNGLGGPQN